ncbi:MAG: low molecular weight phosphotyrosine protein phosphatase [Nocardioidaceae bacterium]|nr:low molecular weight phosphotyrosine protein phosphatase [Nocardioidaceae bacterium]
MAPGATYRVALVCLGNICRSPTADVVLNELLDRAGVTGVEVTSSGTGDWHVGEPMDRRSAGVLRDAGYHPDAHRAQHFGPSWYDHDLILVMDASNLADVRDELPADRHDRVKMFRAFDPEAPGADPATGTGPDLPDPWYGGREGFLEVLAVVERTAASLVEHLQSSRSPSSA